MKLRALGAPGLLVALLATSACGGAAPPAEAPKAEGPAAEAPAPAKELAEAKEPTKPDAAKADAAPEPKTDQAPKAEIKGRNVTYRMTPAGLVIEVEGMELVPKVEAVRTSTGWNVGIKVKASSRDGQLHRLLSPENGPLMVFMRVERGGKVTDTADTRQGDGEEFVAADDSINVERKVPTNLWIGGAATLQVGLWGLGIDAAERRPVKKLFIVKMVGSAKPTPIVTAPE